MPPGRPAAFSLGQHLQNHQKRGRKLVYVDSVSVDRLVGAQAARVVLCELYSGEKNHFPNESWWTFKGLKKNCDDYFPEKP